jgi:hypothetical protein
MALEKVHSGVGQGSVLEQIDKRYRKQGRYRGVADRFHSLPAHGRTTWQFGRNEQRTGGTDRRGNKVHRNKVRNDLENLDTSQQVF